MPQRIICANCGHNLYEGEILKSPQDVLKKYDGRCPNCSKKLAFTSNSVIVTPCEERSDETK